MTCSHFGSSPTHIYSLRDSVLKLLDMPSEVDLAKRELVKVLRALAAKYKVTLSLTRESSNQDVDKAFRRVSLKVHPDKGGSLADFQKLSATNDAWKDLLKSASAPGRPPQNPGPPKRDARAGKPYTLQATSPKKVYTVQGQATLLTYQSFSADLDVLLPTWVRFAPCLRHIHTRILKTSKRLSPFKRLNAPFYSCSHADSPTDVRSPRVDKTTLLPPAPTQSGLRRAPPATIQCGLKQIQANFNLVIVLPESDSLVTQVDIGGGWANGQVGHRPEP